MGRQKKRQDDDYWDEVGEAVGSEDTNQQEKDVQAKTNTKESQEKEKPKSSNTKAKDNSNPPTDKQPQEKVKPSLNENKDTAKNEHTDTLNTAENEENDQGSSANETDDKKKKKKKKKTTAPTETKKEAIASTSETKVATKKSAMAKKIQEQLQKIKEEEEKLRIQEEERQKQEQEEEEKRKQEQEAQEKLKQERNAKKKLKQKEKDKNKQTAEQQRKLALLLGKQGISLPNAETAKAAKKPEKKKKLQKEDEKVSTEVSPEEPLQESTSKGQNQPTEDALESWEDLDNDVPVVQSTSKPQQSETKQEQTPVKPSEQKAKPAENKQNEKAEQEVSDLSSPDSQDDFKGEMRSPICCVLGHVDTGKTKLLDKIRRTNVQEGEAGGITQQIGATFFPIQALKDLTSRIKEASHLSVKVPGLLIIDTPGHESFTNLRTRGSSLCDIAILVVDITADKLEKQTIESINLLKMRKTPFIVALNKIDRIYGWKAHQNSPVQDSLKKQDKNALAEFDQKIKDVTTFLAEQGLNAALYYKNKDFRKYFSIVPTSAITGEGVPDLLMLLVQLTQRLMADRLLYLSALQCTVLEVKVIEGFGTTIDVILVNGVLHEGDTIVVCGMNGPIVTTIRALLTPQPMKELRVKGQYQHHKVIHASQGIKISAADLDKAVPGSSLLVVGPNDNLEDLKTEVMKDFEDMKKRISTTDRGVYVQASTLGSLEALMEFLKESKIPVANINIGPVSKRDVMKASVMLEHAKEYAVILAFDVKVPKDVQEHADELGVKIFTANIIYHLFDKFTLYMENIQNKKKEESAPEAVFPVRMRIYPEHIFNKKDPIVLGVEIVEGSARIGTPIVVPSKEFCYLGRITSIESNHKPVQMAKRGASVAVKLEQEDPSAQSKVFGRHFDHTDELVSRISRQSIDLLRDHFRSELEQEDINLIHKLKPVFGIPTGPKKGAKDKLKVDNNNDTV